jgi:adenylosuccinate lyase
LVEGTPDEMAKYIHWGATTQDIQDDASMLQIKRGISLVKRELVSLKGVLKGLAATHRDT